jgi:hypothetical protein
LSFVDLLDRRLRDEQEQHARQALERPQGRDDFEYGRVCGLYAGLVRAQQILLEIIDERNRRNAD